MSIFDQPLTWSHAILAVAAYLIGKSVLVIETQNSGEETLWPRDLDRIHFQDGAFHILVPLDRVSLRQEDLHIGVDRQDLLVEERDRIVQPGYVVLQYELPVGPAVSGERREVRMDLTWS